jgi:hypothetical protein
VAKLSFAAQVKEFCDDVPEMALAVFRESVLELRIQLTDQLASMVYGSPGSPDYVRTQFLLSSLMASTEAMPQLTRENPGVPVTPDWGEVEFIINNAELGETLFLGYTARYGGYVNYGTSKMPPRPWVDMIAQRWSGIVDDKVAIVRKRFGR